METMHGKGHGKGHEEHNALRESCLSQSAISELNDISALSADSIFSLQNHQGSLPK